MFFPLTYKFVRGCRQVGIRARLFIKPGELMPGIRKQLAATRLGVGVALALMIIFTLSVTSVTAQTIVVADEDFQNDGAGDAMGPICFRISKILPRIFGLARYCLKRGRAAGGPHLARAMTAAS